MKAILILKNGNLVSKEIDQANPIISFHEADDPFDPFYGEEDVDAKDIDLFSLPVYTHFMFEGYSKEEKAFVYREL